MSEDKSFDSRAFNESFRELAEFWKKVAVGAVFIALLATLGVLALGAYLVGQGL